MRFMYLRHFFLQVENSKHKVFPENRTKLVRYVIDLMVYLLVLNGYINILKINK